MRTSTRSSERRWGCPRAEQRVHVRDRGFAYGCALKRPATRRFSSPLVRELKANRRFIVDRGDGNHRSALTKWKAIDFRGYRTLRVASRVTFRCVGAGKSVF